MKMFQVPMHTFAANCYVVVSESGNAFVVDPGAEAENIIAAIEERKVVPKYILLTHGHFDHVGAVAALKQRYGAQIVMNKKDEEQLVSLRDGHRRGFLPFDVDIDATEGKTLALDELTISVMELPGHTRGGVAYLCGKFMFTGDTLFNHDVGRTDLYGGNLIQLLRSLTRLNGIETDYTILPGHDSSGALSDQKLFLTTLLEENA